MIYDALLLQLAVVVYIFIGMFIDIFICPSLMGYVGPQNDQCYCRWYFSLHGLGLLIIKFWGNEDKYLIAKASQCVLDY